MIINNIGYAYATNFATVGIKEVKIYTSTKVLESNSISSLPGATDGVVAKYVKTSEDDLSPFYVSFETTSVDVVGNPLFGKYIVYCKRKNYENSYTGIEIWHEIDMSEVGLERLLENRICRRVHAY